MTLQPAHEAPRHDREHDSGQEADHGDLPAEEGEGEQDRVEAELRGRDQERDGRRGRDSALHEAPVEGDDAAGADRDREPEEDAPGGARDHVPPGHELGQPVLGDQAQEPSREEARQDGRAALEEEVGGRDRRRPHSSWELEGREAEEPEAEHRAQGGALARAGEVGRGVGAVSQHDVHQAAGQEGAQDGGSSALGEGLDDPVEEVSGQGREEDHDHPAQRPARSEQGSDRGAEEEADRQAVEEDREGRRDRALLVAVGVARVLGPFRQDRAVEAAVDRQGGQGQGRNRPGPLALVSVEEPLGDGRDQEPQRAEDHSPGPQRPEGVGENEEQGQA